MHNSLSLLMNRDTFLAFSVVILSTVVLYLARVVYREMKQSQTTYRDLIASMFETLNRNTNSNNQLADALRDLKEEVRRKE